MQPDVVLVELCKSRVDILKYDEELLLREAKNIDMQKLRLAIKQVSWIQIPKQSSMVLNVTDILAKVNRLLEA